ncbi:3-beta hydroxysteroid dehydrogenase [candidate division WWE3 bacterium CG08_land_8_20_14_0_20_43_13]|uniref:3-beta hydroxysteroid dehydrogenase n=1 Tax=candidate division WWE3 bacterium CG08_land_8_20_14_0_20_43_13 TaxID=1975087 RepID=A0A2H0X6S7_UNCKA|nr:MAG: 3-beta hydroxysteroid dehydrogenase [candidate division WWE3 bacterium CG08_land_8_20_14_0_20_43_13]
MDCKNILITGGAGFVGSNLAIKFKNKYPQVRVIVFDNLKRRGSELNIPRLKKAGVDFVHGDVRSNEDLEGLSEIDIIIECSAEPSVMAGVDDSPKYLINTNLLGTVNCLELARKRNSQFIFLSTSRVYPISLLEDLHFHEDETRFSLTEVQEMSGVSPQGVSEDFPLTGYRTLYGATKLSSELLIGEYAYTYKLPTIINRCGVITGPWQMGKVDQGFFVLWVASHLFGKDLSYIGYGGVGKQVRDFMHIDDLFEAIDLQIVSFNKFSGEVFNLGGGASNTVSLLELTAACQQITGKKISINSISETRLGDIRWFVTDCRKFNELTGWIPKKGVTETVNDIYDWLRTNRELVAPIFG